MNTDTSILTTILNGKRVSPEWVELLCDADRHNSMPWQRKYYLVGSASQDERTAMLRRLDLKLTAS